MRYVVVTAAQIMINFISCVLILDIWATLNLDKSTGSLCFVSSSLEFKSSHKLVKMLSNKTVFESSFCNVTGYTHALR